MEHPLNEYPTYPIILLVDNYSSHKAHTVREWIVERERVRMLYLPKYCSHLKPVEPIWLQLKNNIAANRLYASMNILLDTIKRFFDQMTSEQALAWVTV